MQTVASGKRRAAIAAVTSGLIPGILGLAAAAPAQAARGSTVAMAWASRDGQVSRACARWTKVPAPEIGTGGAVLDDVAAISAPQRLGSRQ